jgi:hypothetical protein
MTLRSKSTDQPLPITSTAFLITVNKSWIPKHTQSKHTGTQVPTNEEQLHIMVAATLKEKYQQERDKRIKIEGLSQYLPSSQGSLYALDVDPWIESGTPVHQPVQDGGHAKIVVFGAGFGGICAAIRCLESGAASSLDDILIVDPAGGFGGTWWWNR